MPLEHLVHPHTNLFAIPHVACDTPGSLFVDEHTAIELIGRGKGNASGTSSQLFSTS